MQFQRSKVVASFAVLASLAGTAAHAATVCVDPGKATCQPTIQDGVNAAHAGDTVSIAGGEFYEGVEVPAGRDGLIIKGKNSIIDSSTLGVPGIQILSAGVAISGVVVRNSDDQGIQVGAGANGVHISKVTIQNVGGDCVYTNGDDMVLENSTLVACGSYVVEGPADGLVIRNNTMKHADSGGIVLDSPSHNAVIEKNTISVIEDGDCISVSGDNAEVVGNRIANCDSEGVDIDGNAPYVVKNQVTGAAGFEIDCSTDCTGLVSGNRVSDTGEDEGGFDIDAAVPGLVVTKNRVERSNDEAFYISGDGTITLTSNVARDIGGDNYEPCYEITGNGGHLFEKNSCDSTPDDGFYVFTADGVTFEGNKVVNAFEDGIDVDSGVTNVTISGNQVSAGASGIEVGTGVTGNVTGNKAAGGVVDFCDESAGGVTAAGNKFASTDVAPCAGAVE